MFWLGWPQRGGQLAPPLLVALTVYYVNTKGGDSNVVLGRRSEGGDKLEIRLGLHK